MIPRAASTGLPAVSPDAAKERLLGARGDSPEKVRAAAAEFEAVFLTQMFKTMRKTVPQEGIFSGGSAGKQYQEMLDAEYAKSIAMGGGFGLGKMIARELGGEAAANATPEASSSAAPFALGSAGRSLTRYATLDGLMSREAGQLGGAAPADMDPAFVWPAPGRVTSRFGARRDPITGRESSFHSGVDLATPAGTPVRALAAGTVVESGKKGGYGNCVVVEHAGGVRTLYAHNAELLQPVGATVAAGEPLAISGSTGRSTGPHVHFEVHEGGVPVDPLRFVRRAATEPAAALSASTSGGR